MSASDDLEAAGRNVAQLRESVELMQANLGDTVGVQRFKDGVTRLAADLNLLDEGLGSSGRVA